MRARGQERMRKWREAHREEHRASARRWQDEHPEQAQERKAKWALAHRQEISARNRERYLAQQQERISRQRERYAARDREKSAAARRNWEARHAQELRERKGKYYQENRERLLEEGRARHAANREKQLEQMRKYAAEHPDVVRSISRNRYARRIGAPGRHTAEDVARLLNAQGGRCAACGTAVGKTGPNRYQVDHIIPLKPQAGKPAGSNDPSNLQLLCKTCNLKKHNTDPVDWARRLGRLFV